MKASESDSHWTVIPIADVPNVWGEVTNLSGLMTYFTIFGDSLSAYNVRILYNKGIYSEINIGH